MPILERYLLRLFALRFVVVLALLVAMLQLENYTRLSRLIEHAPRPLTLLARFSLYLLPEYLGVSLLVALFLAVALGVRAAVLTGEWQVFHAAGISPLRLALLPALLGCLCAAAQAAIQFDLQPRGEDAMDHLTEDLRVGKLGIGGDVNAFIDLGDGATLRMDSFDADSGRLGKVFVSQGQTVIVAREGHAAFDRLGNLELLLHDGQAFVRGAVGGQPRHPQRPDRPLRERRVTFDQLALVVPLAPDISKGAIQRLELDRLRLEPLLLRVRLEQLTRQTERPALAALCARLAFVWGTLLLPFVGMVLGAPRLRGRTAFGTGLGIVLIVGFLKLTDFLRSGLLGMPAAGFGAAMFALTLGTWLIWRGEGRHGIGYVEAFLELRALRTPTGWLRKLAPRIGF